MNKFTIRRDLGIQILTLYLFLVVPIIIASLLVFRFANQRLEDDVKAADLALAKSIAQESETTMRNSLIAIKKLGQNPSVLNADTHGMENLFADVLAVRPDITMIYRLDANGIMLYHFPTGPTSTVGNDYSFREHFQRAKLTTQPLISKGKTSLTTNEAVTTAVMPLWDYRTGKFLGIVCINIKLEYLSQLLSEIVSEFHPEEQLLVTIIDSSGNIIAHPEHEQLLMPLKDVNNQIIENVLLGKSGSMISKDEDGNKYLYSYTPVYSAGWGVIIKRPAKEAFATPNAFNRVMIGTISVFVIIGLFFWLSLSRQVIRPLEHLANISERIGISDISQDNDRDKETLNRLSGRTDQIGNLIRSLQRMENAIEARLNELSTLLETSASVVSTLNLQTVFDRILEQVERLFDVSKSAVVALDEKTNKFLVKASRGLSDVYNDHLSIDPNEPQSIIMRAIRSGYAIQISDTETDPTYAAMRPIARAEGYRSVIAVPLKTQHAPPAALLIFREKPHLFSKREISLLTNFANHAAMAFENATLYARSDMKLQEQTRRLEALIQSLNDGLILENFSGKVIYANKKVCEMAGIDPDTTLNVSIEFILKSFASRSNDPEETRELIEKKLLGSSTEPAEFSIRINKKQHYIRLDSFMVMDAKNIPIGRVQIYHDITTDKELDQMKSSLISTVSHELRTPLATIKGYASTLLANDVEWDKESQNEFLRIISDETDRLSSIVSDLLDLSKIEAGTSALSKTKCDLRQLILNASKVCHPNPQDRLSLKIQEGISQVYVDRGKMETVLRNLIENAVKYSWKSSPIIITAEKNSDTVIIKVKDQGPGIPKKHQRDIFRSFYRLKIGNSSDKQGMGLGLAICEGFVKAHGGNIWVEPSETGTCIAFSIPNNEANNS